MRRLLPAALVLVVASSAVAEPLSVPVNQTRALPFIGSAAYAVPGSDDILAVRVLDSRHIYVIGKKAGVTNVVVMDSAGRVLSDSQIEVSPPAGAVVTISRGGVSTDYSCSPYCQPLSPGAVTGATDPASKAPVAAPSGAAQGAVSAPTSTPSANPVVAPH